MTLFSKNSEEIFNFLPNDQRLRTTECEKNSNIASNLKGNK